MLDIYIGGALLAMFFFGEHCAYQSSILSFIDARL